MALGIAQRHPQSPTSPVKRNSPTAHFIFHFSIWLVGWLVFAFVCFWVFCLFVCLLSREGFLCVGLAVLELTLKNRMAMTSEIHLPLPP